MATQIQVDLDLKIDKLAGQLSKLENTLSKSVDGTGQKMGKKVSGDLANSVDGSSAGKKLASEMSSQGSTAGMTFGKMFSSSLLASLASAGIQSAISGLFNFGQDQLASAMGLESTRQAFDGLIGDAQKAGDLMSQIVKEASSTPFEIPELQNAGKQLAAFGFSAEEIIPAIRMVGDVSAGLNIPIGEMSYLVGTIRTQGRAMTADLNQFANRGVPIWQTLSEITGLNTQELRKFTEEGKVSADLIEQAFAKMTEQGGQFYGMMDRQSQTLGGRLSTLNDTLGGLGRQILGINDTGQVLQGGLFDIISNGLQTIIDYAGQLDFSFLGQALSTGIQFITSNFQNLLGVLGSLASGGVVGMIISAFTTLSTSIASAGGIATAFGATMATIFAPINLAIAGISLAVFGLYQAWITNFGGIQQIAQQVFLVVLLPALQQIQIAFQQLLPALQNLWNVLSPLLLPALQTLGLVLGGVLIGSILVFAKTLEIGIIAITNFANWLTSAIQSVVNFSTQAGGSFQSFWSNIQSLWTSGLNVLTTSWNNTWQIVSSTLSAIFLTIVAIFTGNTQQLSTIWSAWLNQIQTAWSSQWQLVSSTFTSIFTGIVSSAGSYLSNLYNSFVNTGSQIVSYLSTLDLTSIGKNMIQGLINGVQSMAGALMSTMRNMAQNAINSAKEALKINSPSKVMIEIGSWTGEGFVNGIKDQFGNVIKTAQGMTGAFTKTLSSGVLATGMIGSSAFGTQAIVPPTQTTTPPTTQPIAQRVNRSEALAQGQADQIFNQRLQATQPTVNPQENEQAMSGMGESVNTLIENLKTGLPEAFKLANERIAESLKEMDTTITEITNMINENWIAIFTGMGGNIPKSIVLGLKANERLAYSTVAGLSDNVLRAVGAEIKGREKGEEGWANRTQSMSYPQIELARNFKTISVDSMAGTGGNVDNSRNINFGNVSVQSNSQMEALAQKINSFSY